MEHSNESRRNYKYDLFLAFIGAIFGIFLGKVFGFFEIKLQDSQIKTITRLIVDDPDISAQLLEKMSQVPDFKGPKGEKGPKGDNGP